MSCPCWFGSVHWLRINKYWSICTGVTDWEPGSLIGGSPGDKESLDLSRDHSNEKEVQLSIIEGPIRDAKLYEYKYSKVLLFLKLLNIFQVAKAITMVSYSNLVDTISPNYRCGLRSQPGNLFHVNKCRPTIHTVEQRALNGHSSP